MGVYIGPKNICAAEVRKNFGQFQLAKFAELPWTHDPSADPAEKNSLSQKIREALSKAGIQTTALACGLSGKEVIVRYLDMPLLPKNERKTAVRYQAQKYVSFEMKELRYSFDIHVDRQAKRMKVLFLAAKKTVVSDYLALLSSIGLKISALEPAALSLIRALFYAAPSKNADPALILDVHNDGAVNIVISRSGMILLSRDCNISKFAENPQPLDFASLAGEVRLTLNYFSRNFAGEKITHVVLCADDAPEIGDWEERLRGEFGIPVGHGTPSGLTLPRQAWFSSPMLIAAGLAMREADETESAKLNLTPEGSEKEPAESEAMFAGSEREVFKRWVSGHAAAVAASVLAAHFLVGFQTSALRGQVSRTAPLAELRQKESGLARENDFLRALTADRTYLTTKMGEMARVVPVPVQLLSWRYRNEETETAGEAVSSEIRWEVLADNAGTALLETNRLINVLQGNPGFMAGFSQVRMGSSQSGAGGRVFEIECLPAGAAAGD
ncbi:MAG: pilus assembly protein PilM [Candidatus Omnitrophica bacterium]|nr:pilus assembly protein PilM [Candidatus Omnitrophota bacterium]